MRTTAVANDTQGDISGWLVGSGILLIQLCAVIPGLLPALLILIVLGLPLVVIGAAVALLVAVPLWALRLVRAIARRAKRNVRQIPSRANAATGHPSLPFPSTASRVGSH